MGSLRGRESISALTRGLGLGLAFGVAASTLQAWLSLIPVLQRGMGPGPLFILQTTAIQIALGVLLGLVAAPILAIRGGRWLHPAGVALLWYGLDRWVAVDAPLFVIFQLVPVLAFALVALGLFLTRFGARLPWGLAALALVAGVLAPPVALRLTRPEIPMRAELPAARADAPDVVLIVLDTVRAESVSTYGYSRPTGPAVDALAREGALFLDATSPSTWSLPSHASLFTGRYPSSHGAHAEHRYLDDRFPTLADVLQGNGYETFCITANPWITDGLGLTRGFGWQDESLRAHGGAGRGFSFAHRLLDRLGLLESDKGGELVATSFEKWARERPLTSERPAFVFLNFVEAHFPYHQLPHDHLFRYTDLSYAELRSISVALLGAQFGGKAPELDTVLQPTVDMYDGGVHYTSELLGRVVEALRERGSLDRTVLVVLADHGEILGERGEFFGHGPTLYQESVGVPLLVRYPRAVPAGIRVASPVSTLGVFATIVDLAGVAAPPTLQVGSLVPLVSGRTDAADRTPGPILAELHDASALAEREGDDPQMQSGRRYRLFREGPLKLVTSSRGESWLYDLASDPDESRDRAVERPDDHARMVARLAAVQAELGLPALDAELAVGDDAPEIDDATREQLRALGYTE